MSIKDRPSTDNSERIRYLWRRAILFVLPHLKDSPQIEISEPIYYQTTPINPGEEPTWISDRMSGALPNPNINWTPPPEWSDLTRIESNVSTRDFANPNKHFTRRPVPSKDPHDQQKTVQFVDTLTGTGPSTKAFNKKRASEIVARLRQSRDYSNGFAREPSASLAVPSAIAHVPVPTHPHKPRILSPFPEENLVGNGQSEQAAGSFARPKRPGSRPGSVRSARIAANAPLLYTQGLSYSDPGDRPDRSSITTTTSIRPTASLNFTSFPEENFEHPRQAPVALRRRDGTPAPADRYAEPPDEFENPRPAPIAPRSRDTTPAPADRYTEPREGFENPRPAPIVLRSRDSTPVPAERAPVWRDLEISTFEKALPEIVIHDSSQKRDQPIQSQPTVVPEHPADHEDFESEWPGRSSSLPNPTRKQEQPNDSDKSHETSTPIEPSPPTTPAPSNSTISDDSSSTYSEGDEQESLAPTRLSGALERTDYGAPIKPAIFWPEESDNTPDTLHSSTNNITVTRSTTVKHEAPHPTLFLRFGLRGGGGDCCESEDRVYDDCEPVLRGGSSHHHHHHHHPTLTGVPDCITRNLGRIDEEGRPSKLLWYLAGGRSGKGKKVPTIHELKERKRREHRNREAVGFAGTLFGRREVGRGSGFKGAVEGLVEKAEEKVEDYIGIREQREHERHGHRFKGMVAKAEEKVKEKVEDYVVEKAEEKVRDYKAESEEREKRHGHGFKGMMEGLVEKAEEKVVDYLGNNREDRERRDGEDG